MKFSDEGSPAPPLLAPPLIDRLRSILAKVKDLSVISELIKHMSSEGFDDVGLRYVGGRWVWLEFDSMDQVESVKTVKGDPLHRVIESFIVSYRNRTYRIIATEFAYWAPKIESMEFNSESNPLERKDAEMVLVWMKEHGQKKFNDENKRKADIGISDS
ncbi:hypothetical protein Tco_0379363 [Tanacetum coccineum]